MAVDSDQEGHIASVWRCDACGKAFRLNRGETLVHTAETGHGSFHAEAFTVQTAGLRNIVITKKPDQLSLQKREPEKRVEHDRTDEAVRG